MDKPDDYWIITPSGDKYTHLDDDVKKEGIMKDKFLEKNENVISCLVDNVQKIDQMVNPLEIGNDYKSVSKGSTMIIFL